MKKTHVLGVTVLSFALAFALLGLFSPDMVQVSAQTKEVCTGGLDEDGDKLVDCNDPDCANDTSCKTGTGCSPGFYKNHPEIWVGICCTTESDPTCAEILTALTCRGSDASCGRSAAAALLDGCTGCNE